MMNIKDILEEISLPARSNKHGFKQTDKLDKIKEILERENSPFYLIKKSDHAWIFGKEDIEFGKETLLISSHADIVSDITKPFSSLKDDHFKGTYDNMGTNAACVELMLNRDMPDNVYFAFTAEEESGRFTGAEYALSFMRNRSGRYPSVIVLDVTYEGYNKNRLFTLEGLHAPTEEKRITFLDLMLSGEGNEQSFEVIRMKKKDDNSFLPQSYQSSKTTDCDESYYYAKHDCLSFSLDLPTSGHMHSDSGLNVKEPVMYGYCDCLAQACYLITNSYPDRIEEIKAKKDDAVIKAKAVKEYSNYYSGYYGTQMTLFDDDDTYYYGNTPYSGYGEDGYEDDFNAWYDDLIAAAYDSAMLYDDPEQFLEDLKAYAGLGEITGALRDHLLDIWEDVIETMNEYYPGEEP